MSPERRNLSPNEILDEAQEFLLEHADLFSSSPDFAKIQALRRSTGGLFDEIYFLRDKLNTLGNAIVANGWSLELLPEITEIIQVLDLIMYNDAFYTRIRILGSEDPNTTVRLSKRVSWQVNQVQEDLKGKWIK